MACKPLCLRINERRSCHIMAIEGKAHGRWTQHNNPLAARSRTLLRPGTFSHHAKRGACASCCARRIRAKAHPCIPAPCRSSKDSDVCLLLSQLVVSVLATVHES
eukprot:scaffold273999_cov23-Tisochrysis_lutea.AAC.1